MMAMEMSFLNLSNLEKTSNQPFFSQEVRQTEKERDNFSSSTPSSFQDALNKVSKQIKEPEKEQNINKTELKEKSSNNPLKEKKQKTEEASFQKGIQSTKGKNFNYQKQGLEKKLEKIIQEFQGVLKSLKIKEPSFLKEKNILQKETPAFLTQENFLAVQEKLLAFINNLLSQNQNNNNLALQKLNPKQMQLLEGVKNQLQELNKVFLKKLDAEPLKILSDLHLATQNLGKNLKQGSVKEEKRIYDIRFEKGLKPQSKKAPNLALNTENQGQKAVSSSGSTLGKVLQQELQTDKNQPLLTAIKKPKQLKNQESLKNSEILKNPDKTFDANLVLKNQEVSLKDNFALNSSSKTQTISKADLGKHILNQVGEKVQGFIGKNFSHISIELKPEHLGNLKIVLDMKNEVLKGRIVVENAQVKEAVQEQIHQIKSILEGSGIQLDSLEVSTRQENNASHQQQENQKLQDAITQGYKARAKAQEIDATKPYEKILEDTFDFSSQNLNRVFITA